LASIFKVPFQIPSRGCLITVVITYNFFRHFIIYIYIHTHTHIHVYTLTYGTINIMNILDPKGILLKQITLDLPLTLILLTWRIG